LKGATASTPARRCSRPRTVVDLSACRTVLSRAGGLVDEEHERNLTAPQGTRDVTSLFAETQTAKAFIGEAAVRIVDRALALSAGPAT